jgi:hypothetical protein
MQEKTRQSVLPVPLQQNASILLVVVKLIRRRRGNHPIVHAALSPDYLSASIDNRHREGSPCMTAAKWDHIAEDTGCQSMK